MSVSLGEHAKTIAGDLSDLTRAVLQAFHRQLHQLARETAIAKTPEGGAGDRHPGLMRRSWVDVPGSIESAVAALQPTKVRNVAPNALIIDRGRRRSENAFTVHRPRGGTATVHAGKMLGSTRAPLGVKGDVLRALEAQGEALFARAAAEAERKVKR